MALVEKKKEVKKTGVKITPRISNLKPYVEPKNVQWSDVWREYGFKDEVAFVSGGIHSVHIMKQIYNLIGMKMPNSLLEKINSKGVAGSTVEVNLYHHVTGIKRDRAGRADLLIEYDVDGVDGALWIELMSAEGKWNSVHQQQWRDKQWPLLRKYKENLTCILIASEFDEGYIEEFKLSNDNKSFNTFAITMNFPNIQSIKWDLLTENQMNELNVQAVSNNLSILELLKSSIPKEFVAGAVNQYGYQTIWSVDENNSKEHLTLLRVYSNNKLAFIFNDSHSDIRDLLLENKLAMSEFIESMNNEGFKVSNKASKKNAIFIVEHPSVMDDVSKLIQLIKSINSVVSTVS